MSYFTFLKSNAKLFAPIYNPYKNRNRDKIEVSVGTNEKIEIVFIRHHTEAKEVSEEEFFNSKETGGTVVTPALELMNKIIKEISS